MKLKTRIIAFILMLLTAFPTSLILSSCGLSLTVPNAAEILEHKDSLIDNIGDGIEYNGNKYCLSGVGSAYNYALGYDNYYRYYDCDSDVHQGEIVAHFIDFYYTLGDISKFGEADFDDNILKVSHSGGTELAFKEGFSLPDYKTLRLKELYLSQDSDQFGEIHSYEELNAACCTVESFEKNKNVFITDIIDYGKTMSSKKNVINDKMYFVATLKDYETIYLGFYKIHEFNNELYVEIEIVDPDKLYKIRDEYQQLLKDKIVELQLKN